MSVDFPSSQLVFIAQYGKTMLVDLGEGAVETLSPAAALARIEQHEPDIIFCNRLLSARYLGRKQHGLLGLDMLELYAFICPGK